MLTLVFIAVFLAVGHVLFSSSSRKVLHHCLSCGVVVDKRHLEQASAGTGAGTGASTRATGIGLSLPSGGRPAQSVGAAALPAAGHSEPVADAEAEAAAAADQARERVQEQLQRGQALDRDHALRCSGALPEVHCPPSLPPPARRLCRPPALPLLCDLC